MAGWFLITYSSILLLTVLTRMIHNAQENDLFSGLIAHIIPKGVAILQYVDDKIVCLKHDYEGARNMKLIMVGLKINFNKSEIVMINDDENLAQVYAMIFNCLIWYFPIKNLGDQ